MTIEKIAQFLKAMAHPTRLEILYFLKGKKSECVCKIHPALNLEQSNVSQHLKILKNSGLVISKKEGQWVHYSIAHPEIFDILQSVEIITKRE